MMSPTDIISDIHEAVTVIETYKLSGLVWAFEDCPLSEIRHYVAKGKEELVVVAHKDDKYLSFRLIFDPGNQHIDFENYRITLSFHPEYHIHIILSTDEDDE